MGSRKTIDIVNSDKIKKRLTNDIKKIYSIARAIG